MIIILLIRNPMKIYLIKSLILVYSTRIGPVKRNIKEAMISNKIQNYNNLSNNLNDINCNISNSYNVLQLDPFSSNCKSHDDSINNLKEFLKFLDCVDVPEPSIEELEKCGFVTFDYEHLKEILENTQEIDLIDDKVIEIHDDSSIEIDINHCNLNEMEEKKIMWNDLKTYIKNYISKQISFSYKSKYIRKMIFLEETCALFDNHKLNYKKYLAIFDPLQDKKFIKKLEEMISNFDCILVFNHETYDKFLTKFNLKIFNNPDSEKIRSKLIIMDDNQKICFFNYEAIKLYKYFEDIPELITLVGLYSTSLCWDNILIIHLINIFAENIKNNKIFILFMISKAFECFHRNQFDIFKITCFELECSKYKHNLYYFPWEFNGQKRQDLERRGNKEIKCTPTDKKDLKAVFLSYLYQTRIFDNYYKIDTKDIKLLKKLIDRVKNLEDCVGCLFDEYMSILLNIIKKAFKL